MIVCGFSTASTVPRVGGIQSFSNPGVFTRRAASSGICSTLKVPSASVRTSVPRTTTDAPASGMRSLSRTRPVTVDDGQGTSAVGSVGFQGLLCDGGTRASSRGRGGSAGGGRGRAIIGGVPAGRPGSVTDGRGETPVGGSVPGGRTAPTVRRTGVAPGAAGDSTAYPVTTATARRSTV